MNIVVSTLGLSIALACGVDAQVPRGRVVPTTLTQIQKSPDAFRNIWVRFTVQFASMGKVQNPFFTQFVPSKFANFYGWSDDQKIWEKDAYEDLFGLLFIDKTHSKIAKIHSAKIYQRLELVGVVRNVFQGKPWIEVTEFTPLSERVNTATLSHMYRGENMMRKRQWKQAIAELSLAPGGRLPNHARGQIHKDLAICFLRIGESETAVEHVESAVRLIGKVDREIKNIAAAARVEPESFLDRTVNETQLEDHKRPMWEAFEGEFDENASSDAPLQPAPAK